ncbi:MAG: CotH kinase family protein [Ruminococcus sp.]
MQLIRKTAAVSAAAAMCAALTQGVPMTAVTEQRIVINEVCAKNTTFAAADGQYYDWVELYNSSDGIIDLGGYGLSDKTDTPYRFVFPEGTKIGGKQRIIVFCDSKAIQPEGQHFAPFGLSTTGETLTLTDAAGITVDTVTFGQMETNVTYGRFPDGSDSFAYMEMTPDMPNEEKSVIGIDVAEPIFSKESGFYNDSFSLTISAADNMTIYYTLDGSEPTAESYVYISPVTVSDISPSANVLSARTDIAPSSWMSSVTPPRNPVDKAFIIRAAAMDENGNFSDTVTKSYFVGYQNKASYYQNLKVISLVTDSDNLYDNEKGIYVLGKVYDDWKTGPDYDPAAQEWTIPANYTQKGAEWEREASMEIFENGSSVLSQNVGLRIHGGATRSMTQKSFNVYARSEYGASKIDFDLFSGAVSSQSTGKTLDKFDSFMLRNGGNDGQYTRFRDKLNQTLVSDRNILTQGMEPCIVFIDGEYWGQYEITEKLDEDFISAHYGVGKKDICIVKNETLDTGDAADYDEWTQLYEWIKASDLSNAANYSELCEKIDMQSFMDYVSAEIYFNNWDWGGNNMAMWKSSSIDNTNPFADGKWRFILFDTEYSVNLYGTTGASTDSFRQLMENKSFLSDLFSAAIKNETFKSEFCRTFMDMANENFDSNRISELISQFSSAYHDTTIDTYNRFWPNWPGGNKAESSYSSEVNSVKDFYSSRYSSITGAMKNTLGLRGSLAMVTVKNDASKGSVSVNTITPDFSDGSWSGNYYTDYPIALTAEPKPGYRFVCWETSDGKTIGNTSAEIPFSSDITVTAVYEESENLMGDVNLDGKVDAADAVLLQKYILCTAELTAEQGALADVCSDGIVNSLDLAALKQIAFGKK